MYGQSQYGLLDLSAEIKPLIHKIGASGGTIVTFIAARPGEGTSTVARSFARAFNGDTGKKVLLIETGEDETASDPGIVELAASGRDADEAMINIGSGLFVGKWATSSQGKNASGRVIQDKKFWQSLSNDFDAVIIDAPALQTSLDGIAFAQASHQSVLVVEAETTRKEVVENLRDTLTSAGAKITGVVMNKRKFYIPERVYKRL
jgi:Mrp family chromosome partitioning ATPase